jgi:hypothetical protein
MKRMHRSIPGAALALLICAPGATAAVFCVNTSAELGTALNAAGNNGEDDVIRIKTGTYATGSGTSAFGYGTSENFDIALEGGWVTLVVFDCGRRVSDPMATVLSGSGVRRVLRMVPSSGTSGDMSIENLSISDGNNVSEDGGGLKIGSGNLGTHNIRIERVFFDSNIAQSVGGGAAIATAGIVELRNNLFFGNRSGSNGSAAHVTALFANATAVRSFIGNNTVVANSCSAGATVSCVGGIEVFGSARATVYNNAFFANGFSDVNFAGASGDLYFNNLDRFGGTPVNVLGNVDLDDPLFTNVLALDFRLRFESPLRDAGTTSFVLGAVDFADLPRINGDGVDIGAFENDDAVLKDSFETLQ